ncbi:MAG: YihY/virulence factor BrkB family protein [Lachnospiraceae bacterium]|nr:YihY/virulence factor BrkB family protein [Lachnospiraceae bacterium]
MKKTRKIYGFINNLSLAFGRKNVSDFAASAAFFLFLSLIPLMILVFSIIPYTFVTEEMLINLVVQFMPAAIQHFVIGIISEIYASSAGVLTVSIVVTLWSAGKGMQSLIRGLNVIYEIEENRSFLVLRAIACIYTVIMMAAVIIMMGLLMFGRLILNIILRHFPQIQELSDKILSLRYPVSIVVLIIIFTAFYCLVPSKKQRFTKQLPGAVFSGIVWSVASGVFSVYLNMFDGFSTYGSMATIIIFMFYMYMMMYIILMGAFINHWLGRTDNQTSAA